VGAFQPRTLKVDGLDKFDDSQLFYRVRDPAQFAGKNLVIVGGGDSALDWALNFVQEGPHKAESVILLHRRDGFKAAPASVARMRELCDAFEMQLMVGQVTGLDERDGRLSAVKVTGGDGVTRVVPLDMLLVFFGLSPKLGPIAELGPEHRAQAAGGRHREVPDQRPGHLRGRRHQHLSGQEEADPVAASTRRRWPRSVRRRSSSRTSACCCSTRPPARSCTRCWAWSHPRSTTEHRAASAGPRIQSATAWCRGSARGAGGPQGPWLRKTLRT
jgi:hypothetical protein